ncbi:uncharacterized protein LOC135073168 isoform X5 [Ostrinia nubilalis]|uniref:uncharacterized protein LOC135073168 isoform X5 n=1 Tax=Ostrinia nubilalis TaxID=29057 RepID=UPI00308264E1
MVNGNYVLYGDRPSSESEIVDDHVHAKTAERKNRRKAHRTANELQSTLNMAQLDNETDSIKYEKRIKEPMLLRYVPTTDVEEHYVSDKFETYDLKPANEERPRRYAFTKKPKNPADGSVNYAYSRSSSSCSSPNGNLPTISEHAEQYGTYRVRPVPSPTVEDIMSGYESKLDKYFSKPREVKKFAAKVSYNGSHPDSLYRVSAGSGVGAGKLARALRIMRWPAALILVCVALAVFVYFLMPDNIEAGLDGANGTTYWEQVSAGAGAQIRRLPPKKEQIPDSKGKAVLPQMPVPQCRSTRLALCRGILPYDLAGPAAHVNGVEITSLLSQIEFLVSTNCSERVQHFMCALLEPECSPPPYPVKMPCYSLCKAISDSCDGLIPRELTAALNCNQYSSSNCVAAKSPCYPRELPCGDGTCIPRDWICDGAADCPAGEDEDRCVTCEANEFKCPSGGCILKRWMCDGYTDCPGGEDEAQGVCEALGVQTGGGNHAAARSEPGEESAGSAPAPAVRKPFRIPPGRAKDRSDVESSKELLVTSDSSNALKRNFTRRPSLSRLTPYTRPKVSFVRPPENPEEEKPETTRKPQYGRKVVEKKQKTESAEDVNIGDLGFFDDIDKGDEKKRDEGTRKAPANEPAAIKAEPELTHLDKTISKLEKVIDGAALLRKAAQQDPPDSPETNGTTIDKEDDYSPPQSGPSGLSDSNGPGVPGGSGAPGGMSSMSSHASPCPSGELRCVDGRCITLAQLCDGTIDCFDHADEDNCYT